MKKFESTRLIFAILSVIGSFLLIALTITSEVPEVIGQQVVESLGWFLTAVATGYLGTKIVEHGTKHMRKDTDV